MYEVVSAPSLRFDSSRTRWLAVGLNMLYILRLAVHDGEAAPHLTQTGATGQNPKAWTTKVWAV